MPSQFTERDTEQFYDAEDALYRSFWDKAGSLHWGIFDESTSDNFLSACANLGSIMVSMASIAPGSRVLDLGLRQRQQRNVAEQHHRMRSGGHRPQRCSYR